LHDPSPKLLKNKNKSRQCDPFSRVRVRDIDHIILDKTALPRFLWGKYSYFNVETDTTLPTPHHSKYMHLRILKIYVVLEYQCFEEHAAYSFSAHD
jgi:hypothetical protein